MSDEQLRQELIAMLKADLNLITRYTYQKQDKIDVAITAFRGQEDSRVSESDVQKWQEETSAAFNLITRQGGHRYIEHDKDYLISLLNEQLIQIDKINHIKATG